MIEQRCIIYEHFLKFGFYTIMLTHGVHKINDTISKYFIVRIVKFCEREWVDEYLYTYEIIKREFVSV